MGKKCDVSHDSKEHGEGNAKNLAESSASSSNVGHGYVFSGGLDD